MRSEFVLAINQLCAERKLSPEVVMEAVEASLISAYRRNFGAAANIEVRMNPDTGDVRVFAAREVVDGMTLRQNHEMMEMSWRILQQRWTEACEDWLDEARNRFERDTWSQIEQLTRGWLHEMDELQRVVRDAMSHVD